MLSLGGSPQRKWHLFASLLGLIFFLARFLYQVAGLANLSATQMALSVALDGVRTAARDAAADAADATAAVATDLVATDRSSEPSPASLPRPRIPKTVGRDG